MKSTLFWLLPLLLACPGIQAGSNPALVEPPGLWEPQHLDVPQGRWNIGQIDVRNCKRLLYDHDPTVNRRAQMEQLLDATIASQRGALLLDTRTQSSVKVLSLADSGFIGVAGVASGGYAVLAPTRGSAQMEKSVHHGVRDIQLLLDRGMVATLDRNEVLWLDDVQFGGGKQKVSVHHKLAHGTDSYLSVDGSQSAALVAWKNNSSDEVALVNLREPQKTPTLHMISPKPSRSTDKDKVARAAFSPSPFNSFFVAGLWDGRLFAHAVNEGAIAPGLELLTSGRVQKDAAFSLAFSPKGAHFGVGLGNGDIRLWKVGMGVDKELRITPAKAPLKTKAKKYVRELLFDYQSENILAFPGNEPPEVFSVVTMQHRFKLDMPKNKTDYPVALGGTFSTDGNFIWVFTSGKLIAFDARSGKVVHTYQRSKDQSKFVSFEATRTGRYVSLGMSDGTILILRTDLPPEVLP